MTQFAGETVEKVVRRSGISIAELARRVDINRRSIYNWFEQETLSIDIIYKIGNALGYDFTADFPDLLSNHSFRQTTQPVFDEKTTEETLNYWKNKYIGLLEKYNDLLSAQKPNTVSEESAA